MTLTEALGIRPGVTALVGAGGKTSAMLQLARELRSAGQTVAVTTTTHIFPPPADLCGVPLYNPGDRELAEAAERGICAVGRELDAKGKMTGLDDAGIEALAQHFSYVLASSADGPTLAGKIAVGIGFAVVAVITVTNLQKRGAAK